MVESTIDKIKDITVERQIRKLAGVIDEQNQIIETYGNATEDINNLKTSDANQNTEINKLKTISSEHTTDINELKASDTNQTTQINNLKQSVATDKLATESAITALQNKDAEQDGTLTNHATLIQGITESLVSDVQIMPGTTTGDIKVRLGRESATAIDSNNYNLGLPVSAEIIQGTGPSMFKIQITMSTGVKVVSNDFVFTTEAIGNDVYISSFTFKAGNQDGYLSADIGLNNGVTIEANNFLVPTDPNVTSAITDLQSRVSTTESKITELNNLKTTVNEHTTAINTLNSDVADLTTDKADVNNNSQTITAGTINATNINKGGVAVATINNIPDISGKADLNNTGQTIIAGTINSTNINKNGVAVATVNDISGKVNIAQGTANAGKVLGINASGNVEPTEISSGGEVWEEVDLSNFPTDWVEGDRVKIGFKVGIKLSSAPTSWTSSIGTLEITSAPEFTEHLIEFIVNSGQIGVHAPIINRCVDNHRCQTIEISTLYPLSLWNSSSSLFTLKGAAYNGSYCVSNTLIITSSNISTYAYKVYRLKQ